MAPPDTKPGQKELGAKTDDAKMVQQEIKYYSHRYQIALLDHLSNKERMDLKLSKQKRILDKYKQDRDNLIKTTFVTDQARRKEIEYLHDFVDYIREKAFLDNEVYSVREEMKELDKRNKSLEKEIKRRTRENIKKKVVFSGIDASSSERAEALVNTLENKLCQARTGLNQIIMTCKEYRRDIDDGLTERLKFRAILENVTTKLKIGKTCMLDMLEQAAVVTAKRELAKGRIKKLISDHKNVTSKQAYLYRELHSNLSVLINLATFQSVKIQRRVLRGYEAKRQLSALIKRQDIENGILQLKLVINNMKLLYGVTDNEAIGRCYRDSNSIIMSLLMYCVHTFRETESFHRSNAILQFTTDTLKEVTRGLIKNEAKQLQDTYSKYISLQEEVNNLVKRLEYAKTIKEFTILRLNMMFNKAGGNIGRFAKRLGDNHKITAENAILMIKEIERKITYLVGILYMAESLTQTEQLPLKRLLLYMPNTADYPHADMKFYGLGVKTPCPVCAEAEHFGLRKETKDVVEPFEQMKKDFMASADTEQVRNHLHSVSHCHLPGSRRLLQQRFLKLGY